MDRIVYLRDSLLGASAILCLTLGIVSTIFVRDANAQVAACTLDPNKDQCMGSASCVAGLYCMDDGINSCKCK